MFRNERLYCDILQIYRFSCVLKNHIFWLLLCLSAELVYGSSLSTQAFLDSVESKNVRKLESFFLALNRDPPTLAECKIFIYELKNELSRHYRIPSAKFSLNNIDKKMKRLEYISRCHLRTAQPQTYLLWSKDFLSFLDRKYLSNVELAEEPPADFVIGLVEMFAGSLLFVIPNGYTRAAAASLFSHGFYQVIGSLKEIEIINKTDP